jgi:hypothetical protein
MKKRRTTSMVGIIAGALALLAPGRASAGPQIPYVELSGAPMSRACERTLLDAADLLPRATACHADSDCEHFPCSCSAISTNAEGERYRDLVGSLQRDCRAAVVYAYCGSTKPVCAHGVCSTRSLATSERTDRLAAGSSERVRGGRSRDVRFLPPDHEPREWSFVTNAAAIPPAVRVAFEGLCRGCTFPEFGPTLVHGNSLNPNSRRLLEAGESGTRWALRYAHGGACVHEHWVVFERNQELADFLGGSYSATDCEGIHYQHATCDDRSGRSCEW